MLKHEVGDQNPITLFLSQWKTKPKPNFTFANFWLAVVIIIVPLHRSFSPRKRLLGANPFEQSRSQLRSLVSPRNAELNKICPFQFPNNLGPRHLETSCSISEAGLAVFSVIGCLSFEWKFHKTRTFQKEMAMEERPPIPLPLLWVLV